jgi:diguanylate cyclase (GGDEF)-like protein
MVGPRLTQAVGRSGVLARMGGDEFAVVLGPDAELRIEDCAEQISNRIRRPINYAGREIRVGASIGMAVAPADGRTAAALIATADVRMYQRKRGGRRLEIVAAA